MPASRRRTRPAKPRPSQRPRTIALGDVHGCADALDALLHAICPQPEDLLVFLGDYIDRGPDSRRVIDRILSLRDRCRLVTLRGNHEQLMLDAEKDPKAMGLWTFNGGDATLDSYGATGWNDIPDEHIAFLGETALFHETDDTLFVHANYVENLPLEEQDPEILLWRHLHKGMPGRHASGKTVFLGHTLMLDEVFDLGHLVCIDTGCFAGGRLTAMDVHTRETWQATASGQIHHTPPSVPA